MGGLRLGRIFGIPIQINFSFLLLMGIFMLWQGPGGVLLLVVTFVSVLLHELGHALVARRFKVPILGIDLHFFGGAAKMGRMPSSPREEILIAVAGPLVSFALALVAFLLLMVTRFSPLGYLAGINLVLGVFNLLPALPMDGGRILRAALSRRMGRMRATAVSVTVARVIAVGLGLLGLFRLNFFLVGLAVLLWFLAGAELRAARLWHHVYGQLRPDLGGQPDGTVEVLDREGRPVGRTPGAFTVEEQRTNGARRWIIRGPDGQVIFMAEQPLRW
jgi:Zn-dependent protease